MRRRHRLGGKLAGRDSGKRVWLTGGLTRASYQTSFVWRLSPLMAPMTCLREGRELSLVSSGQALGEGGGIEVA
jgi:hypothetical protein